MGRWAHTGEGPAAKRSETREPVGGPTPARAPRRSEARRGSRWVGPHRRGPRGEAKRDEGAGGWAHTGEGPTAKRSETREPVGGPTLARAPRRSEARRGSRWVGPHWRGPHGEAKRDEGAGGWAHTGEGPTAKRSETREPVGTRVTFVSTSAGWDHPRTSFYTDHYELTMLQASLHSGAAHRKSVFEAFARRLPDGRRYGIVAGTGRLLEGIASFRFGEAELDFLERTRVVNQETLEYLANFSFSGDIWGYAEGEAYFPNSPILIVESTFAEACILETYILSILNHDSAIASAASRMITAAGTRPCVEMGSRRTQEESAVAAARAAVIAGFASTSNLEAGRRYGIKTVGTAAHSFTLLHDTEREAFEAQLASMGSGTALLVDTYDVEAAVRTAVELAGDKLGAVRLDSGDLVAQAQWVRQLLDELGNENTRIIVTSDLDEFAIAALQSAPVDSYGVGTSLVTGSGAPTASMVYKLVSRTDESGDFV